MNNISRRDFSKKIAILMTASPLAGASMNPLKAENPSDKLQVYIFSKHLQFLDFKDMSETAAELGFDGIDLTVRPGGHVEPQNVETDLPKAAQAMKKAGLPTQLITTAVDDAQDTVDERVLRTAAEQGFKFYRMNWLRYPKGGDILTSIKDFQSRLKAIGELNEEIGLVGCYQNHAGILAGSSLFELNEMIKLANDHHLGVQYDIRHAVVEGGKSWENGLKLIVPRVKTLVLKDFKWARVDGVWETVNTPLGEGMVDFKKYFKLLKAYKIKVPVSLHLEYDLGGAQHGAKKISIEKETIYEAMRKDLAFIHRTWASL